MINNKKTESRLSKTRIAVSYEHHSVVIRCYQRSIRLSTMTDLTVSSFAEVTLQSHKLESDSRMNRSSESSFVMIQLNRFTKRIQITGLLGITLQLNTR